MMLVIGLLITIPVFIVINKLEDVKLNKVTRIILNTFLILISVVYIVMCFMINKEPFNFKIYNPMEYIMYSGVIFVFSPFLWIVTIYYLRKLFKGLKIKKNSIIKRDKNLIYYRDTLNEVSPGIIMFTSAFDIDYKKCISATVLKLKLMGFFEKKEKSLVYTKKDDTGLLDSEKQVLNLVKSGYFDKTTYKHTIEKEALKGKYIKKNLKGIWRRIIFIILIALFTFGSFKFSFWFDKYVFKNYKYYIQDNNKAYFWLKNDKEVEKLYEEVEDVDDYYEREGIDIINGGERMYYSYDQIQANKLQYSVVRKAWFLNILTPLSICFCVIWTIIAIYLIINQLIFINKNYRRTSKGIELLNKAYALKNYLKDYSLIKDKKEEEIVLWEYYLVYATLLNVNDTIQDEVIEKYLI